MIKFFPEHTNWYKGNLHSHTTNSDGAWTPDEAVEHYKANGYAFLCLSDHNLYTDYRYKYNSDLFLILPGTEIAAPFEWHFGYKGNAGTGKIRVIPTYGENRTNCCIW